MNETVINFGFCVLIFANPGMAFFRTPSYEKLDWKLIQETVVHCEEKEYDSVFVRHLFQLVWSMVTNYKRYANYSYF